MRFYSFGTDYKYALDRISCQEIYTDSPDGEIMFAFVAEVIPSTMSEGRLPGLYRDDAGRPHILLPDATLDYEVVIKACHIWMAHQGIPDQPVWFLALPPGKSPEEFLTF